MKTFTPISISQQAQLKVDTGLYPFEMTAWQSRDRIFKAGQTHYGMVTSGQALLLSQGRMQHIYEGMYFVCRDQAEIRCFDEHGLKCEGIAISIASQAGFPQIGGPIENHGRLTYIDGCSDTLLVCPAKLGEPCLNHLHIPAHTNQSQHTHPSDRIGVISRGRGRCLADGVNYPLEAGMAWYIPAGSMHSFITEEDSLDVLAWHPDSDFGPEDENHPMINRTCLPEHFVSEKKVSEEKASEKKELAS